MRRKTMVASKEQINWRTPKKLYKKLDKEFHFDFDPCPSSPTFNGLDIEWGKCNFVNPPYSRKISLWIKKGYNEWRKGKTVVFLLPSRSDTLWWHNYVLVAPEIRFIKGRLKFSGHHNTAPFSSCIVIFKG